MWRKDESSNTRKPEGETMGATAAISALVALGGSGDEGTRWCTSSSANLRALGVLDSSRSRESAFPHAV